MSTLLCDMFPAEVLLPDERTLRGVRVQATSTLRVLVWHDVTGVAKLAYTAVADRLHETPDRGAFWGQQRLVAETAGGLLYANATGPPGGGCGCGGQHALARLSAADAVAADARLDAEELGV